MVENVTQIKSGIMINVGASVNILKKHRVCKKDNIWNFFTYRCGNGKYSASFIDDSVTWCDKIIDETRTVPTNFNGKNGIC